MYSGDAVLDQQVFVKWRQSHWRERSPLNGALDAVPSPTLGQRNACSRHLCHLRHVRPAARRFLTESSLFTMWTPREHFRNRVKKGPVSTTPTQADAANTIPDQGNASTSAPAQLHAHIDAHIWSAPRQHRCNSHAGDKDTSIGLVSSTATQANVAVGFHFQPVCSLSESVCSLSPLEDGRRACWVGVETSAVALPRLFFSALPAFACASAGVSSGPSSPAETVLSRGFCMAKFDSST